MNERSTDHYFSGIRIDGTNEVWRDVVVHTYSAAPVANPIPEIGSPDECDFNPNSPVRGDFDGDGFLTVLDFNLLIDMLFYGAPLPDPPQLADLNCDGVPDAIDLNYMIDHLFFGGPVPCF